LSLFAGFDTSNYTTSAALYDSISGEMFAAGRILTVETGSLGLRQSDALFMHVSRLPEVFDELVKNYRTKYAERGLPGIAAVAASTRPREVEGSYMPCFLAGKTQGEMISKLLDIPFAGLSHQQGHIAAGAWSAGRCDILDGEFLALHISGGTSELLHVAPRGKNIAASRVGGSNDLAVGQLIDRCGRLLGLGFPSGRQLEELAAQSVSGRYFIPKFNGFDFSVSGMENQIIKQVEAGEKPCDVAAFTLGSVTRILDKLLCRVKESGEYRDMPVLCVGGVMSNRGIKAALEQRHGCIFARPEHSSDNAAGIAYLASRLCG
jgi:N6-L-threonylcarbamoyladenine synthase